MHIHLNDDERVSLTLIQIQVLVSLSQNADTAYHIAQVHNLGISTVRAALRRLELPRFVEAVEPTNSNPGKPNRVYVLTGMGELALQQHLELLEGLVWAARLR